MKSIIMDKAAMGRSILRISNEVVEKNKGTDKLVIIGIIRRGEDLAKRIAKEIEKLEGSVPVYSINIRNFRDDIINRDKNIKINIPIENKNIVLVDDVFFTGRTVRAALNALSSSGRPKRIQLATLIDRGHRELPIRPDFVGKNLPTSLEEKVVVLLEETDGIDQVYIEK
ncbi:bifunctional pyr operon transcriptional regulator/uracil phosphoribosyltransferase PyrR [Peptoniphilus catoniae]|uniref:bifunctional pyr operon transcriptional regulator/uracil phosphoribosyltransferase PyrR n=1 Tax=Peptoniphilus catoniae TaxID=1660341 RepID=UPI0010FCF9AF|nr:bifunctional pyr operon transcriptional regulator/uracil phosphoribosyltransferase PyrR [Peptoniphilus catoniae]